jgi:hypothetical protein
MFSQTLKVLDVISVTHHKCVLVSRQPDTSFSGCYVQRLALIVHPNPCQAASKPTTHLWHVTEILLGNKVFLEFQGVKNHSWGLIGNTPNNNWNHIFTINQVLGEKKTFNWKIHNNLVPTISSLVHSYKQPYLTDCAPHPPHSEINAFTMWFSLCYPHKLATDNRPDCKSKVLNNSI